MLKNISSTLYIILLLFFLSGCISLDKETEFTFIGTIEEIEGNNAFILIEEGDILNSGNQVVVDLSIESDLDFEIGDKVIVGYDGMVMESFPLGINTISLELIE